MDRKAQGEIHYREKFAACGLDNLFEFLKRDWESDNGRRVLVRCKTCGNVFYTWGVIDVFKGRQDHIFCIECGAVSDGGLLWKRSSACDEAMAYYVQGHTVSETAEKFQIPKSHVNNVVKERRLTNGRKFSGSADSKKQVELRESLKAEAEARVAERLDSLGFEYLGGYNGENSRVKYCCRKCGEELERTAVHVKKGNVVCPKCEHKKATIRQLERRIVQIGKAEVKRAEKKHATREQKNHYKEIHEAFLDRTGICEICGKPYTVREYVKSCGLKQARDSGVCSDECRKEKSKRAVKKSHKGRRDSHRHRAVKFGCSFDSSVTLKKLIKRDGLRCAICGEMCDPNDREWSEYFGPLYPTIDHIIPMAKGGGHTWDNVQVAHAICNSYKGDSVKEVTA